MRDATMIVRERQLVIRREMDRRGISLKAVSLDSGIPYATIVSYFPGERDRQPAAISGPALFELAVSNALPLDLLSLILPAGFAIVRAPETLDHDEFEKHCREYLDTKGRAHRADSPGGRELTDGERSELDARVVPMRAAA